MVDKNTSTLTIEEMLKKYELHGYLEDGFILINYRYPLQFLAVLNTKNLLGSAA